MLHLLGLYRIDYSIRTVHRSRPCTSLPVDCASTGSLLKHQSISAEPSLPRRLCLLTLDGTLGKRTVSVSAGGLGGLSYCSWMARWICRKVLFHSLVGGLSFWWSEWDYCLLTILSLLEGICSCLPEEKRQMRYPM
jgi:hypothetical protein